jgi:FtsZ-interacting cell division protein ZipA
MKYLLIALLVIGLAFAGGSLKELELDVETVCDETTEKNLVTVLDDDDDPFEGVFIKVEDIDPWKQKFTGTTNSSGEYTFTACNDKYNVTASYGGYVTKTITVTLPSCNYCKATTPPPPPSEPEEEDEEEETTTANDTSTSVTQPTPPSEPASPAVNNVANETEKNETEEAGETTKKKKLPCCPSAALLLLLLAIRAKS